MSGPPHPQKVGVTLGVLSHKPAQSNKALGCPVPFLCQLEQIMSINSCPQGQSGQSGLAASSRNGPGAPSSSPGRQPAHLCFRRPLLSCTPQPFHSSSKGTLRDARKAETPRWPSLFTRTPAPPLPRFPGREDAFLRLRSQQRAEFESASEPPCWSSLSIHFSSLFIHNPGLGSSGA